MDCLLLAGDEACRLLFGSDDRRFGEQVAAQGALQPVGALDLADKGTLVLRHVEALGPRPQDVLSRYLSAAADGAEDFSPSVRLIATSSKDLAFLEEMDVFAAALMSRLAVNTLEMPCLTDRKRDILPLANLFLHEHDKRHQQGEHHLNRSAEHTLVSARYRSLNAVELREAVELAAFFADGAEIGSEYIFTGPKDAGGPAEYDLAQAPLVQPLIRGRRLAVWRACVLAFFFTLMVVCLMWPATKAGRIANGLTWGMWWPGLLAAFLLIGRVWCTVCPISSGANIVGHKRSLSLAPPHWMKQHAVWWMALLFVGIVWAEHVFHMTAHPFATGILFAALMTTAAAFRMVYQRQVWCRYLCPLGGLGAGYSFAATLGVRANPSVCSTQCRTYECFKGSATVPGCPVFHHPLYARDGHLCKLCLECLQSCPHGSTKLYLRPPLQGLWRPDRPANKLGAFALVVFFIAIVMLASHKLPWLDQTIPFTAAALLGLVLGVVSMGMLWQLLRCEGAREVSVASPVCFVLLVLASGPLMAFHLENVPGLSGLLVGAEPGSGGIGQLLGGGKSLLAILQGAFLMIATTLAAIALWRIQVHYSGQGVKLARWRWGVVWAVCGLYLVAAFALITLRGIQP